MEINTIKKFKYKGFDCIVKRIGYSKGQSVRDAINLLGDDDFSMRQWWLISCLIQIKVYVQWLKILHGERGNL